MSTQAPVCVSLSRFRAPRSVSAICWEGLCSQRHPESLASAQRAVFPLSFCLAFHLPFPPGWVLILQTADIKHPTTPRKAKVQSGQKEEAPYPRAKGQMSCSGREWLRDREPCRSLGGGTSSREGGSCFRSANPRESTVGHPRCLERTPCFPLGLGLFVP